MPPTNLSLVLNICSRWCQHGPTLVFKVVSQWHNTCVKAHIDQFKGFAAVGFVVGLDRSVLIIFVRITSHNQTTFHKKHCLPEQIKKRNTTTNL